MTVIGGRALASTSWVTSHMIMMAPPPLSLHVMQLVQALPENKLASLLAQRKFREAETFALEYKLNCEVIAVPN